MVRINDKLGWGKIFLTPARIELNGVIYKRASTIIELANKEMQRIVISVRYEELDGIKVKQIRAIYINGSWTKERELQDVK